MKPPLSRGQSNESVPSHLQSSIDQKIGTSLNVDSHRENKKHDDNVTNTLQVRAQ